MKLITICLALLIHFPFILNAQHLNDISEFTNTYQGNSAGNPCISAAEYALIEQRCEANMQALKIKINASQQKAATTFNWPLKAASSLSDCDIFFIGAYVDQNTTTGVYNDFNCSNNTYDGHHGTDIAAWPFGFYKMDNNLVEVIAAAP